MNAHDVPRFVLLAPAGTGSLPHWQNPNENKHLHENLVRSVQRFRSRIYRKDGAIQEWQLDAQGGFRMRGDDKSWHLILLSKTDEIAGCARYLLHPNTITFGELVLRNAALARDQVWGKKMRAAFETEIRMARSEGVPYVELGGWALSEEFRGTKAALKILLASFAWGRLIGGCRCACTATVRHGSSSILRRLGGSPIEYFGEQLPSYHDPAYGCEMELLRFDWRHPNPRFLSLLDEVEEELKHSMVITSGRRQRLERPEANGILVA
jgi:hypothetical protein